MATLPTELLSTEILHHLPVKSLSRFKCLSKSFETQISSHEFIELYLRNRPSSLLLVGDNNSKVYFADMDSPERSTAVTIPFPRTLEDFLHGEVLLVGSYNGLVCLGFELCMAEYYYDEYKHVLINPSTGMYREIPKYSPPDYQEFETKACFGFGFDETNADYKIVGITDTATRFCPYLGNEMVNRHVSVYSLKKNGWRTIYNINDPSDAVDCYHNGVLLNKHLIHWLFWGSNQKYRLGCFDVESEKWTNDVPLMELVACPLADFHEHEDWVKEFVTVVDLGVLDGCLCLLADTRLSTVVWIMKEYGVKDSWTKLIEIPSSCALQPICSTPLCYRKGSKDEVLLQVTDTELVWYNVQSKEANKAEIHGLSDVGRAYSFKDTPVLIPGGQKRIEAANQDEGDIYQPEDENTYQQDDIYQEEATYQENDEGTMEV